MTEKALLRHIIIHTGRNLTIVLIPGLLVAGLAGYGLYAARGATAAILGSLLLLSGYLYLILTVLSRSALKSLIDGLYSANLVVGPEDAVPRFRTITSYLKWVSARIAKADQQAKVYTQHLERVNRELLRTHEILEHSPVVVFEWPIPAQAPAIYVSRNISRFGYTPEDLLGGRVDFYDLIHPEDLDRVRRMVEKARQNRLDQYTYMYRIMTRSGEVKWVEDWTVLVRDVDGELVSEKGMLRDVTQEVTLTDKASESDVRYRELFENASALIFTCDFSGRFTSANRECLALLGADWESLREKQLQDFLDVCQPQPDLQDFAYLETYLNEPIELKITCGDGQVRVIETRNSLLYKGDIPYEIQTVAHDITARKMAEAQIEYLTYHDRLTGLYNRLYFDNKLKELEDRQVAVIIGDMNGLKLANDAFGHSTGDQMLIHTSRILEESVTDFDAVVARLSGDEFAILLPEVGKVGANMVCERIRTGCEQSMMQGLRPSIALGFSAWNGGLMSPEEAMREAEDNMYHNKLNESKSIRSAIIHSLQASLEEKTTETRCHAERLKVLALRLGKAIGLGANDLDELALTAIMHDIGKIGIPDSVLTKPGPLDNDEWLVMRKHPEVGYHIILSSPNMAKVAEFILCHHERWDGTGYPQGLQRDSIPLISRIIAVVDSYDVMTSDRPYKTAMSVEDALAEIDCCAGTQFDPHIAAAFTRMMRVEREAEANNYSLRVN